MNDQLETEALRNYTTINEQIRILKQKDETLYNILVVDVWALVKTMDEHHPGFWADFRENREKAFQRICGRTEEKTQIQA